MPCHELATVTTHICIHCIHSRHAELVFVFMYIGQDCMCGRSFKSLQGFDLWVCLGPSSLLETMVWCTAYQHKGRVNQELSTGLH